MFDLTKKPDTIEEVMSIMRTSCHEAYSALIGTADPRLVRLAFVNKHPNYHQNKFPYLTYPFIQSQMIHEFSSGEEFSFPKFSSGVPFSHPTFINERLKPVYEMCCGYCTKLSMAHHQGVASSVRTIPITDLINKHIVKD